MLDRKAPHSARVAACCAILDRGYGRPAQQLEHTGKDGTPLEQPQPSMLEAARRLAYVLTAGAQEAQSIPKAS